MYCIETPLTQSVCPFSSLEMHSAKMHTMGAVARRLCAANQRAIFAMAATFSRDAAPPAYQCEVNESASIDALGVSTPFVRFVPWHHAEPIRKNLPTSQLSLSLLAYSPSHASTVSFCSSQQDIASGLVPHNCQLILRGVLC